MSNTEARQIAEIVRESVLTRRPAAVEPAVEMARLNAMANILGELLFAIIRSTVAGWAYSLWIKLATWLDPKIKGRWAKVAVGGLLGLAAYFVIPVVMGLLGL